MKMDIRSIIVVQWEREQLGQKHMKNFKNVWKSAPKLSDSEKRVFKGRRAFIGNFWLFKQMLKS